MLLTLGVYTSSTIAVSTITRSCTTTTTDTRCASEEELAKERCGDDGWGNHRQWKRSRLGGRGNDGQGATELGVKVEVKNMNSFRAVEKAIAFELARQTETLDEGGSLVQETRLWDADREETRSMRTRS